MSILVVGISHRTAPVDLLEQIALDAPAAAKLRAAALESQHVSEAVVLATCNRVEIYAEVDRFHASVDDLTALLAERADVASEDVVPSLYVHYDEGAVAHLFSVVTGLDSMVVGEGQILGQVRDAFRQGQAEEAVGTALNSLFQQGLRVGKRAHAETGIDRAGQSVVSVALDRAAESLGSLAGRSTLIVGAGSMAALAAASVRRVAGGDITVINRSVDNAGRLAKTVLGATASFDELAEHLASADIVMSCTGATGVVITRGQVAQALSRRTSDQPLVVIDLALPHDVDPTVTELGVVLIGLSDIAESVHNDIVRSDVEAVKAIVAEEVAAYVAAREAARVTPTLIALRTMATGVVATELERLWGRTGNLTDAQREEISLTARRVADKLLHEPTIRIKELVGRMPESSYADALAELFALDAAAVEAVTKPGDTA